MAFCSFQHYCALVQCFPLFLCSLSGLSPFLGDDESQTLNNVLAVNWYFEEEAVEHISAEARDFISNLLIREKG